MNQNFKFSRGFHVAVQAHGDEIREGGQALFSPTLPSSQGSIEGGKALVGIGETATPTTRAKLPVAMLSFIATPFVVLLSCLFQLQFRRQLRMTGRKRVEIEIHRLGFGNELRDGCYDLGCRGILQA